MRPLSIFVVMSRNAEPDEIAGECHAHPINGRDSTRKQRETNGNYWACISHISVGTGAVFLNTKKRTLVGVRSIFRAEV
jgi:hypothetical protein